MTSPEPLRAAIYARVSTLDQEPENQLAELRRYIEARSWAAREYVDKGISGAKDKRPALDQLVRDAKRRQFDCLVVWRLDRLGRSLLHLILLLDELTALDVKFVSLSESIDTDTPAGRLQLHLLAAIAQFERERIVERIKAGMARAKAQGKRFGRPERYIPEAILTPVRGLSMRQAAVKLGVAPSTAHRWLFEKGS